MKKLLFFFIFVLFLTPKSVFAQTQQETTTSQAIRVSPILQELTLTPGVSSSYQIQIENLLDKPMGITTSMQAFTPNGDSDDLVFSKMPKNDPIVSWTNLSNPDIILGPHESKELTVFVTPPANTKYGGYYEAIFLTPLLSAKPDATHPVVETRLASLLFTTIGTLDYSKLKDALSLLTVHFPLFSQANTIPYAFTLQNKYTSHILAKPTLTISSIFGGKTKHTLTEKRVLAQTERTWKGFFKTDAKRIGIYQIALAISYGNGQQLTSSYILILFPYVPFLIFIGVCLLVFLLAKAKKRLFMAGKALLGK